MTSELQADQTDIESHEPTGAVSGPSGCGKSSLLRCFNHLNDLMDDAETKGDIRLAGIDIHDPAPAVSDLRRRVGMVFQVPNPFPKSIAENVAYGLRLAGTLAKSETTCSRRRGHPITRHFSISAN